MLKHEKVFQEVDKEKKGYLNKDDTKIAVMMIFGYKISKWEAERLLTTYGAQQETGVWGLNVTQFGRALTEKFTIDKDEEIRNAFMAFDKNCRGFLTIQDMKHAFQQVCPHFPEHRLELAFRELDGDSDGRVSYKDFDFMMKFDPVS